VTEKINQKEINETLWKACDTFRGTMDPTQYKDYILVFLFLKYLSDIWKDAKVEYEKQYKGEKERINRKLERERFYLPEHCTYEYIYEKRDQNNIGEIINKALEEIEERNKAKLDGVFRNIDFNSESNLGQVKDRNRRLKHIIEDFSNEKLDFRPSRIGHNDIIGDAYEYLIYRFASDAGKKGGEFYTPAEVSKLLAKLLKPKAGDRLYDPACGSGSLLIKMAKEIGSNDYAVFGQENNGSTWALCKMNMFLHEIDGAKIEWGDTLNNPLHIKNDDLMRFDVVVANPPFSLDKWGAENAASDRFRRFERGVPPKSKGDYAFILHMIASMLEGTGRVGVVVPHGVLFRGGSEGKIRQSLIEENLLDAVIGLPANLFYGVGIPVAILVFKQGRKKKEILFIDGSKDFDKDKTKNVLLDEHIEKIVKAYRGFETIDKYAYLAGFDEIKDNEFNLNIPRYVDSFKHEKAVNLVQIEKDINNTEKELIDIQAQIKEKIKELGL
jgi:type I restriction enzyme M protein